MLTVITPTIPGREDLLAECRASVTQLGLPHLVELDQHGEGPAAVRNRLVERAGTEWVLFLDDDDVLLPNYVDTVRPYLPNADVVYTDWKLTGAVEPLPQPFFDEFLLPYQNFIPVTACVRTEPFRRVGGFPTGVHLEDHALWVSMLQAGCRFQHVGVVAWWYRRQPQSRTTRG